MSKEEVAVGDRVEFTGFQMAGHTGDHHAWEAILVHAAAAEILRREAR